MNKKPLIKELNKRINLLMSQLKRLKPLGANTLYLEGKIDAYEIIKVFIANN